MSFCQRYDCHQRILEAFVNLHNISYVSIFQINTILFRGISYFVLKAVSSEMVSWYFWPLALVVVYQNHSTLELTRLSRIDVQILARQKGILTEFVLMRFSLGIQVVKMRQNESDQDSKNLVPLSCNCCVKVELLTQYDFHCNSGNFGKRSNFVSLVNLKIYLNLISYTEFCFYDCIA
jgi:hypothetical protein